MHQNCERALFTRSTVLSADCSSSVSGSSTDIDLFAIILLFLRLCRGYPLSSTRRTNCPRRETVGFATETEANRRARIMPRIIGPLIALHYARLRVWG